jgi:(2Fe-2S) ferredoxin
MSKRTIKERAQALLTLVRELVQTPGLTWVDASNAVYAPGGPYGRLFPTQAERIAVEKTKEGQQIETLIHSLPGPPVRAEVEQLDPKCFVPMPHRRTPSRSAKRKLKV